jgi:hypothetical protein
VEERERRLLREKQNEIEREGPRMGVWGARGARLGAGPGRKPTTRTTTYRNPIANQSPKRGETDA